MKISCEVIKDLLPLYHDGVCSNESKAIVEEHLAHCDQCNAELRAMLDELIIHNTELNLQEAESLQKLSRKWKKGMYHSLFKGIFITVLAAIAIFLLLYIFMDLKVVSKP